MGNRYQQPPEDDSLAALRALEERTRELEKMAFSYSVLAEVSREMNRFLDADEMLAFTLEIVAECAGFAKGMILVYSPEQENLTVKCCKLFTQTQSRTLKPVPDSHLMNLRFPVNVKGLRELELSGNYILPVEEPTSDSLVARAFPGLLDALAPLQMEVILLLAHRGSLKGAVIMGERIAGSTFQVEGNLLVLLLADLSATCLEAIHARQLTTIDDLTKLHTFSYVKDQIEREIERAACLGERFSLIILDIDKFRAINEQHGHPAGDELLRVVAMVLKDSVRTKLDIVSRYGGDEFLVLLPSTTSEDAAVVSERMRSLVARIVTDDVKNPTISAGISFFPTYGATVEDLIGQADRALYEAKREGGNRVFTVSDLDFSEAEMISRPAEYRHFIRDTTTSFFVGPYFTERLRQEMLRARRYRRTFSLVLFGLSFETVPERTRDQRHMDEMLRVLSLSIITQVRKEIDLPTRYSKGKVLLLLPETDVDGAIHFAVRIRELLRERLAQLEEGWGMPKVTAAIVPFSQTVENERHFLDVLVQTLDETSQQAGDHIGISDFSGLRFLSIDDLQEISNNTDQ